MIITTSWIFATCACPSWSSIADESALRSALASLNDSSSSLHWWLEFWTFLVALGVVLEVVFVVWEYLDELHDFRRGIIHAPERPQTVPFVLGLFGAGLVAAGVSGEFWKDSQIATVETCIRKGNDALFLLLSKEAARLQKEAENERSARLEIQDGIAWRTLTKDQIERLGKLLEPFSVQGTLLTRDLNDTEAATFFVGHRSRIEQGKLECIRVVQRSYSASRPDPLWL